MSLPEAVLEAISRLMSFEAVAIIVLGALLGLLFGALPGMSSITGMVLVLPFTFGMDPHHAMYLYAGIIGASSLGGSIPAILINTPGTTGSVPACLDGYPMTREGKGAHALGIAAASSLVGTIVGAVILLALIPAIRPIILSFGAPETLLLISAGLIVIAFVTPESFLKGLASGGMGLMLAMVGINPATGGIPRFTMESDYLYTGLPLVPVFIGVFALGELITYSSRGGHIARTANLSMTGRHWRRQAITGSLMLLRYKLAAARSAVIGVLVGIIPGMGAPTAAFLSYAVGKRFAVDTHLFGKGNPEGLITAEVANDAKDGGALLPTVALGVPGSADQAVLLAAFVLHGLTPGPQFLANNLPLVIALIIGLVASQVFVSLLVWLLSAYVARISIVNVDAFAPFIVILCMLGGYAYRNNVWDVVTVVAFGLFGYILLRFGYPLVTFAMGLVLGVLFETAVARAIGIGYGSLAYMLGRPITLIILAIMVVAICVPFAVRLARRVLNISSERIPIEK